MSAWSAFLIPFVPFVYGCPSSSPCTHCTLNKSVPTGRNCFAQRPQKRECLLGTGARRMGDERVKAQSQAPTRKTKMPWPAARTTKCYGSVRFAIAQQLVYHAVTVPTAVRNRITMSVAPLLGGNWCKRSPTFKPSFIPLLLIYSGLTWGSSTTSLLLISPGPAKASSFFVRVQLTSLLLISPGLCALHNEADDIVGLNVLGCQADILGKELGALHLQAWNYIYI